MESTMAFVFRSDVENVTIPIDNGLAAIAPEPSRLLKSKADNKSRHKRILADLRLICPITLTENEQVADACAAGADIGTATLTAYHS
jgi:hypothetical protein